MGRPIVSYFPQISSLLEKALGADEVKVFAEPFYEDNPATSDWYAIREGDAVPLEDVTPVAKRRATEARLAKELRTLRQLAREELESDSLDRRTLGEVLMHMTEHPATSQVYVVDGAPTVVFWGFANERGPEPVQTGRIAQPVQEQRDPPPKPGSTRIFSLNAFNACVVCALVFAFLAVGLRAVGVLPGHSAAFAGIMQPKLDYGPLQTSRDAARRLQDDIDLITQETLSQALACASTCMSPRKPIMPILPKPPKVTNPFDKTEDETGEALEIPEDSAETKSVEFLRGRWRNLSGLLLTSTNGESAKSDIVYEFDKVGKGKRFVTVEDGRTCEGPIKASIAEGGSLIITETEPARCDPPGTLINPATVICRLNAEGVAVCKATYKDGDEYNVDIRRLR